MRGELSKLVGGSYVEFVPSAGRISKGSRSADIALRAVGSKPGGKDNGAGHTDILCRDYHPGEITEGFRLMHEGFKSMRG